MSNITRLFPDTSGLRMTEAFKIAKGGEVEN